VVTGATPAEASTDGERRPQAPVETPAQRGRHARQAIVACASGAPLGNRYSAAALAQALHELPGDLAEYTDCPQRLGEAQLTAESG
jgi:hypothetical protein